ncbi:MAG: PEP-CTERM sorting domain-containing protein [Pseudomonadota bacterium]
MKIRGLVALVLTTAVATGFSSFASAGALSCVSTNGATTRTWGFNSADSCGTGEGNPNSSADIESLGGSFDLGATDWDHRDGLAANGSGSLLTVNLVTGTWGGKDITATWSLAAGFWETFGKAVFTVHVGGGSHANLSDFGAFFITEGQYSGTWSFAQNPTSGRTGGAGGLSNAHLWTAGTGKIIEDPREPPAEVPEPGVLLLLASGLLGLGLGAGRKAKA